MLAEVFFGRDEPAVFFGPVLQILRVQRAVLLFGVFVCGTHLFFNGFVPSRRPNDKNKTYQFLRYVLGFIKNTPPVPMASGEGVLLLVVKTDGFSKWRPTFNQMANLTRGMKVFVFWRCLNIDTMS